MRGILSFGRAIINTSARWADEHFAFHHHPDGIGHGWALYARIPMTRLSALVERRECSVGLGLERAEGGFTIYLGRHQIALCHEQGGLYRSGLDLI